MAQPSSSRRANPSSSARKATSTRPPVQSGHQRNVALRVPSPPINNDSSYGRQSSRVSSRTGRPSSRQSNGSDGRRRSNSETRQAAYHHVRRNSRNNNNNPNSSGEGGGRTRSHHVRNVSTGADSFSDLGSEASSGGGYRRHPELYNNHSDPTSSKNNLPRKPSAGIRSQYSEDESPICSKRSGTTHSDISQNSKSARKVIDGTYPRVLPLVVCRS